MVALEIPPDRVIERMIAPQPLDRDDQDDPTVRMEAAELLAACNHLAQIAELLYELGGAMAEVEQRLRRWRLTSIYAISSSSISRDWSEATSESRRDATSHGCHATAVGQQCNLALPIGLHNPANRSPRPSSSAVGGFDRCV